MVQDAGNVIGAGARVLRNRITGVQAANKILLKRRQAKMYFANTSYALLQVFIIFVAAIDIMRTGDIGRFALISGAGFMLMGSTEEILYCFLNLQQYVMEWEDARRKLITPVELDRKSGRGVLKPSDTKITFENVSFAYPVLKDVADMTIEELENKKRKIRRGEMVLNNINLVFNRGGLNVIAGRSGHGKTTLVSLIRHDYDILSGRVLIGAQDVNKVSDESMNNHVMCIDQNVHFFAGTIAQNLRYFNQTASARQMMAACRKAGFADDVEKFSDGLNHHIGQDGAALSGGQRQRLALARMFLCDSRILVLDEPTTGLDPELSRYIIKELKKIAKTKTVIVITHMPEEILAADRCVVIADGRAQADGKIPDLIKSSAFIRAAVQDAVY